MASIEINGIRKSYGALEVMHGVSLSIKDGEFIALVGPSGCGKSTLLRMIAGLEEVTKGDISIGNAVVNDLPPRDRDIAMVFQSYALYPHKTVADNMGFALKLRKTPKQEVEQRVRKAAEILDLVPYLSRYPRELSGGQRQRVAMGRAIVRDPAVFLFDEPLSNLDAKLRVQMRGEIKELYQRLKTTTVYVTHDQVEAMTMADRIAVLRNGHLEQVGTPIELYDHPKNVFVAGFIGSPSMNFIRGRLMDDGSPRFISDDGVSLPVGHVSDSARGKDLLYGVRPEHFIISETGVECEVRVVEPTGAETAVVFMLGQSKLMAVFRERINAKWHSTIKILPDVSAVHLFDAESGKRIE